MRTNGLDKEVPHEEVAAKPTLRLLPQVRTAGPADEQEVYRLLLLCQAENAVVPASNAKVVYYVQRFLSGVADGQGPSGVFGVIGQVGALEAICMLAIGNMWYSENAHLEEYLVFVDPNCRNGGLRHGQALIEWMKAQARRTRLKVISGIVSNHRTAAKCRLYGRHLPKIGEFFMWDPEHEGVPVFDADSLTGPGSLVVSSSKAA